MIGSAGRIAARRAPTTAVRRMSTAEPKMHKAKEWQVIKDSRPKTHDHVSSFGCTRFLPALLKCTTFYVHYRRIYEGLVRISTIDLSTIDLQITKSSSSLSLSSTTAYLLRFILLFAFPSHVHTMCCETTKILVTKQSKQLVFEGDFPKLGIGLGVLAVIGAGYGSMYFGMWHQQKKQGYWK